MRLERAIRIWSVAAVSLLVLAGAVTAAQPREREPRARSRIAEIRVTLSGLTPRDAAARDPGILCTAVEHSLNRPYFPQTGQYNEGASASAFRFTKPPSPASPLLAKALTEGRRFKTAVFRFYERRGPKQELKEAYSITLDDAMVTRFALRGSGAVAGEPQEEVSLDYTRVTWQYGAQKYELDSPAPKGY
jgi:type VI secretion system Hcp family effector